MLSSNNNNKFNEIPTENLLCNIPLNKKALSSFLVNNKYYSHIFLHVDSNPTPSAM